MQMTWDQLEPRYEELEQHPLTPENVADWLHTWSELEKDVEEQGAVLQRAKDEDTRDRAAEDAYLMFIREVIPQAQVASQSSANAFATKLSCSARRTRRC